MRIEITTKKAEGAERLLEVSVPVDLVREAEEKAVRRYATQARLPGFRPGKAPAAMVRKKFGAAIRQEALEALMQDAYREVLEREKLTPVTQPHVHHVHFDEGKPLSFELHVEVRPEITLARTQGFRVARPASTVTDEQVAEQIERLREQKASLAPVDGKPLPSDLVTVTLATAEADGGMPAEGKEYRLELGGGQAIPGIEELIMELSPGETVERPVRWPEDFPDEEQRGATKTVRVTLTDVKRRDLPVLDDAFAREVGDFDSLDALRAAVRQDLQRHAERDADAEVRQKLVDEIIAANPFDVPASWVGQLVGAYAQAYQVPDEQREQFQQEFRPMAERQVRRDLVIDTIAEREGLAASEADIDARVAEVAAERGNDPGKIYAAMQKAGRLKEIERGITEEKVFAWLIERNQVE